MTPNKVKIQRSWCPKCAGREQTIEDMRNLAYKVGLERTGFPGLCLSNEYKGATKKLWWKCGACSHEFPMIPNKVKSRKSWCPKCAHKIPPTIEELQKLAYDIGVEKTGIPGEFISDEYTKSRDKYVWWCGKCKKTFEKSLDKVKHRRSWCPICSKGYNEKICGGFMERIFSYIHKKEIKFLKTQLNEIIIAFAGIDGIKRYSPDKIGLDMSRMHIDGFNYELRVGFERNGRQHYERVEKWQQNIEDFNRQLKIDKLKKVIFDDLNLLLITVGFEERNGILSRIEPDEMQDHIIKQVEHKIGKRLPKIPKFNHKTFLKERYQDEITFRKQLGERLGFKILTSIQQRLLFEFKKNDKFISDLLKMSHLNDIKSIESTIRDFHKRGYLTRRKAFNPNATGVLLKQYKYSLSELGKRLLTLSYD